MLILRIYPPTNSLYFRLMISVVILGTGNVAQNLSESFQGKSEIDLVCVVGRSKDSLSFFKDTYAVSTDWINLPKADIYIIAVKDDVIPEVSEKINEKGLVVHTSGSVPLNVLSKHARRGVFYPLQTFTAGKILNFKEIPLCLEVNNEKDSQLLLSLAKKLSDNVQIVDSEKRKILHVAAVFVNNFTNYMYSMGNQICEDNNIDFSMLFPLIQETAAKIEIMSPKKAQTGPAKRQDLKTLHGHLQLLKDEKHKAIYTLLSNAIKEEG